MGIWDYMLRRLAVAGRRWSNADVRLGQAWTRNGWRLSRGELEQRSLKRLAELVAHFRQRRMCADPAFNSVATYSELTNLEELPILTRAGAIELYRHLNPLYAGRRDVYSRGTGGWTGEPVHYFRSRRLDGICYGMRLEMQTVMGWRPGMACFCLWANPRELGLPQTRRRSLADRMRMVRKFGRYSPTAGDLLDFLGAVRRNPRCAIYGSPGLLVECVHFMRERRLRFAPGHVSAAWSTAESMDPRLLELFPAYFGAVLRDFYGSRETSSISAECSCGSHHINSRYIVEICDEHSGELQPAGQAGVILITDLFNDATPLIRYQIGDCGAVNWHECRCGRHGYVFTKLTGRPPEVIELVSGRRLTPYSFLSLAQSFPGLHRVQLVRHGPAEFEYRYAGLPLDSAERRQLGQLASALAEGAAVRLTHVADVTKSPSGKQHYYIDARYQTAPTAAVKLPTGAA